MGQVIGQSSAIADEPHSDPVTLDDLFATVIHTLVGDPLLHSQRNLPRNVATSLMRGQPIAQLI